MIITEIAGTLGDPDMERRLEGAHVEKVSLPSDELVKRIQRVTTDHGRELGIRLAAGAPDLKDGDVLLVEETDGGLNAVVVATLPSDVLVIRPTSIRQMGFVAHSLGNRHLQAQFFGAESDFGAEVMVVQYDHTVEDFLTHHGVAFERRERVMEVPFRHAEHTH
ncbi:urease accessory protein UreE [Corynebacterium liangguodongii]|uniref:Urease accessory protein UreE n=1 Tax=Corynebacterium liangguodongii TaxID=2079535 RepID=A0A2S0WET6_9CORY|nr:urease accessory protein UreE [Corynebacterium liangguodongii]AWB84297.1 urease accessory protein UreE [Corynebacterium liangguodongii]PWB99788.1 urease accessory protein UreE [Corynebacterium liangguodongii]